MRTTSLCTFALIGAALTIAAAGAVAAAQTQAQMQAQARTQMEADSVLIAGKKRSKSTRRRARRYRHADQAGHIACFPDGCRRIPSGCVPTQAYDIRGNPTGFDTLICR